MKDYVERREAKRLGLQTAVRVYPNSAGLPESFLTHSADLSAKGIFVRTEQSFLLGEWLYLEFEYPGENQTMRGLGRVVRTEEKTDGRPAGIALQFCALRRRVAERFQPWL